MSMLRRRAIIGIGSVTAILGVVGYEGKKIRTDHKLQREREQILPDFDKKLDDFRLKNNRHQGPFGIRPTGGMKVLFVEDEGGNLEIFHLRKGAGSDVNSRLGIVSLYDEKSGSRKHFFYPPNQDKETIVI